MHVHVYVLIRETGGCQLCLCVYVYAYVRVCVRVCVYESEY